METVKVNMANNIKVLQTFPTQYGCPVCNKTFNKASLAKWHVWEQHPRHSWHCDSCNKYFETYTELKKHRIGKKNFMDYISCFQNPSCLVSSNSSTCKDVGQG